MVRLVGIVALMAAGCGFQVAGQGPAGDDEPMPIDAPIDTPPTEPTVTFASATQTVTEADTAVTVIVRLAPTSSQTVTVPFTVSGTASASDAMVAPASPLTFAPGESEVTVTISIHEDSATEGAETLVLTLDPPSGAVVGGIPMHTVQIDDDDAQDDCLGAGAYAVCTALPALTNITLSTAIDTSPGSLACAPPPTGWTTSQGQPDACFIYGNEIQISNTVSAGGTRPLVLVAELTINVNGVLDVASHRMPFKVGPGAPGTCGSTGGPGGSSSGGGGGPGGTFRTRGGDGGNGKGATGTMSATVDTQAPTRLRAGCNGRAGGVGDVAAGEPGRGGGAVYLVAGVSINVAGTINASGAGASNGGDSSGGSGGGSGGMIKLSAPQISVNGRIVANGGGGSSGASDTGNANPGLDPTATTPSTPAPGGTGPTQAGGAGFAGSTQAGSGTTASNGSANAGGGGGGGGGGYLEMSVSVSSSNISAGQIVVAP